MTKDLAHTIECINREHLAVEHAEKSKLDHAFACGEYLAEAKEIVEHGNWEEWLAKHCPNIPERTSTFYMRLSKNRAVIEKAAADEGKRQHVADLSLRAANKYITKSRTTPRNRSPSSSSPSQQQEETLSNLAPDEVFRKLQAKWTAEQLTELTELLEKHLEAIADAKTAEAA
jgi:hypothetical protein